jgi:hypothetical protein
MGTPRPVFTLVPWLILPIPKDLIRDLLLLSRKLLVKLTAIDQHRIRRLGLQVFEVIREDEE